jgi:hypothetical protein
MHREGPQPQPQVHSANVCARRGEPTTEGAVSEPTLCRDVCDPEAGTQQDWVWFIEAGTLQGRASKGDTLQERVWITTVATADYLARLRAHARDVCGQPEVVA